MKRVRTSALACLAAALLFPAGAGAADASPAPKPNIVLIISDDQGWGDYSFMGHSHLRTPHLDQLAAQSLLFPRGYATSSLCCPSLASILPGLYPHQSKITSNDPPKPPGQRPAELARDENYLRLRGRMVEHITRVPTLSRLLQEHGHVS